jgi:hypothetical protein
MTSDVGRAVADLVAAGLLAADTPAGEVRDLIISHARSLDGIEVCKGLETLSLIGCSTGDYSLLSHLSGLRVIAIENCDLADVAWAAALELRVAVVRRNRLRDATALLGLSTVQSLDLTGNPLDEETRRAAESLPSGRLLMLDDAETARVNVLLAEAATGLVAYRDGGRLWVCATGLDLTGTPEAGHMVTTLAELAEVIRGAMPPRRLLRLDENEAVHGCGQ